MAVRALCVGKNTKNMPNTPDGKESFDTSFSLPTACSDQAILQERVTFPRAFIFWRSFSQQPYPVVHGTYAAHARGSRLPDSPGLEHSLPGQHREHGTCFFRIFECSPGHQVLVPGGVRLRLSASAGRGANCRSFYRFILRSSGAISISNDFPLHGDCIHPSRGRPIPHLEDNRSSILHR